LETKLNFALSNVLLWDSSCRAVKMIQKAMFCQPEDMYSLSGLWFWHVRPHLKYCVQLEAPQ